MPENPTPTAETAPANGPEVTPDAGTGESTNGPAVAAASDDGDPAGTDALGDAGKKALDTMKAQRNAERDRRKQLEARIAELEKPAEGSQPDADQIRTQAEKAATTKANNRILRAEIKAAATGKFADPSDALLHLQDKLNSFEVNEDGDVDSDEISEAIEDLLTRKPHLAAKAQPRFQGSGDGGAARKASGPSQLTRADLKGKSPEWISNAKAAGQLNDLLGIKNP